MMMIRGRSLAASGERSCSFTVPDTTLPEFSIQAKRGIAGRFLMGITAKLVGMPTFELEDQPGFNDKFTVVTANPESVRVLLVRDMVDAMVRIENLNLAFMARGLLFTQAPRRAPHQPHQRCPGLGAAAG